MFVAAIGWRVGSSVDNVVVVARQAVIAARVRLCKYRDTRFGIHMSTLRRTVTQPAVCDVGAATSTAQNWSGHKELVSDWSCDNDAQCAPDIFARTVAGQWR
ncbi:conserved hypothetical protein [Xanthomonas citri pv. citri]|uniref:Uncharacterized protein n=1 Tax=Xanthomonas citri pv. citri TaxID=611301 RepID=A0A0U5FA87_XANCI|nr:conserved hypothetical protein [Xanthomonas citri pv. citri]CEE17860.1 conserved hypothetical protein [Xanthomonas citri pv. citri]CEE18819.1 conserved hypothetical protein [Xanthomonas citri pv. citri]CEE25252.1 conserved hypothetical protein [Xanthomonas citri pv. citri]CEE25673.1 conserved hypothetical protein [Xanthomonas citri pv. citri]